MDQGRYIEKIVIILSRRHEATKPHIDDVSDSRKMQSVHAQSKDVAATNSRLET